MMSRATIVIMLLLMLQASGEPVAGDQAAEATPSGQAKPTASATDSIDIDVSGNRYRSISIHSERGSNQTDRVRFFHTPLFLIMPRDDKSKLTVDDWLEKEKWVWGYSRWPSGGGYTLEVQFKMSNQDTLQAAQQLLVSSHGQTRPYVARWPIKKTTILLRGAKRRILGSGTEEHAELSDQIVLGIDIPDDQIAPFQDDLAAGAVYMEVHYAYEAEKTAFAKSSMSGSLDLQEVLNSVLSSEQRKPDAEIFQRQVDEAVKEASIRLTVQTVTNDASLIAHTKTKNLTEQMFIPAIPKEIGSLAEAEQVKIAEYLTPLKKTLQLKETKEDKTRDNTKKTIKGKVGIKIPIKSSGTSGGHAEGEVSPEKVHEIERTYGIKFEKTEDDEFLHPHSIKVYKVATGSKTFNFSDLRETIVVAYATGSHSSGKIRLSETESAAKLSKPALQMPCPECQGRKFLICTDCGGRGWKRDQVCNGKGLLAVQEKSVELGLKSCPDCSNGVKQKTTESTDPAHHFGQRNFRVKSTWSKYDNHARTTTYYADVYCGRCTGSGALLMENKKSIAGWKLCPTKDCSNGRITCQFETRGQICRDGMPICWKCSGAGTWRLLP